MFEQTERETSGVPKRLHHKYPGNSSTISRRQDSDHLLVNCLIWNGSNKVITDHSCSHYHQYRKCATNHLSSNDRTCNDLTAKTIENMIDGYSGEVINYVCHSYRDFGSECVSIADLKPVMNSTVKEEIPKSFFSLMVKIYLSWFRLWDSLWLSVIMIVIWV